MENKFNIDIFQKKQIRKTFYNDEWFYSVVDVIGAITESGRPAQYWTKLKEQLESKGFQLSTKWLKLKLPSKDGKLRKTDCANMDNMLDIIHSMPSKNVDNFREDYFYSGKEYKRELKDPSISYEKAIEIWKKQGKSDAWIELRKKSIDIRKETTDGWKETGVVGKEYGILTNIGHVGSFDISVAEHKKLKNLGKSDNLREYMTSMESTISLINEEVTKEIAKNMDVQGFEENKIAVQKGSKLAGNIRKQIEEATGKSIVSPKRKELE